MNNRFSRSRYYFTCDQKRVVFFFGGLVLLLRTCIQFPKLIDAKQAVYFKWPYLNRAGQRLIVVSEQAFLKQVLRILASYDAKIRHP